MEEFDPLNSPSRTQVEPIVSNSPFSALFAPPQTFIEPPPLIDFTSSPSPPGSNKPSFQPRPLSLNSRQTLFPPSANQPRRSSPLKFSILEDSFSDFPPSFADTSLAQTSQLGTLPEHDCDEGGLVSFIQDSPPPSLSRRQQSQSSAKENTSPTRRVSIGSGGKKWGVINRMKEERARRRSRSLSPVKETVSSPFNGGTREGDSIAQIGNVDLSLIQDEAGSFLLADDSAIGQSFENDPAPLQSPGNLSQIGEEEEDEEEEEGGRKPIEEEVSVGLSTMFLNKRNGPYDLSMIGDQSKFAGALAGGKTFDQSTLPRNFQSPNLFTGSTSTLPRSNSSSSSTSILPPELVSPVKSRSTSARPPPSATKKPFQSLPTPAPSPPTFVHSQTRDESHFSMTLPQNEHCSFLNKSSQSFIKECKSPRKRTATKGRISDLTDTSEEGGSTTESDLSSGSRGIGGGVGEMTEFGFTQLLGSRGEETSTAILNQLPPTAIFNPETTRTIELCLQPPLRPDNSLEQEEDERDDLASSTRTIKPSKREEVDLMGMEEPSLMYQNQTLAFAGDLTMENQSVVVQAGGGGVKETGAERLKRRMAELRAQQSLYTIPATPAAATNSSSSRFVSLLDQTPQVAPPNFGSHPQPRSTARRTTGAPLGRSKSESLVVGGGGPVGKLISFDTPASSNIRTTSFGTPARGSSTVDTRRLSRASVARTTTPLSRPTANTSQESIPPKTPGERKESTRARLERMRSERKQREEELLTRSASPEKPSTREGAGLGRSSSVGSRVGKGITRSSSGVEAAGKGTTAVAGGGGGMRRGTSLSDVRGKPSTLTERMAASTKAPPSTTTVRPLAPRSSIAPSSESMPPPSSTRRASLVPTSSSSTSSRLVKRQSLLPTSTIASAAPRPSSSTSRAPLKPTTSLARPAGPSRK